MKATLGDNNMNDINAIFSQLMPMQVIIILSILQVREVNTVDRKIIGIISKQ